MMIALQLFVKKTKLGKAMRAVPQDKDASTLVGINVNKIITTTLPSAPVWLPWPR